MIKSTSVSVIVSTYNGEKKIPVLLKALSNQSNQEFELIVVVDGSTDNTVQIVKDFTTSFTKRIIVQANLGRAVVKNNGAQGASGDVLIFYDDDMEPNPDSIQLHISFHQNCNGLLSGNLVEIDSKTRTDIQNYKANLTQHWMKKYSMGLNQLDESNVFFSAANCSMLKQTFDLLGGFDNRLTDAEDFELAIRALKKNIPVYFDKSNGAIHHDQITCKGYIKRLREYNLAHQKVYSIHPDVGPQKQTYTNEAKVKLYSIFAFALFPNMIDNFNVFLVLPKTIRYRLYNIIIHSLAKIHRHVRL